MISWFISILRGDVSAGTAHRVSIQPGMTVQTPWGPGKVIGGCIHVDLVGHHPNTHENDHHVTLELNKVSL